ncbi:MAG: hypothetical protein IPM88_19840 [Nitrospira sp.]|nr:hypothetical protein [Nitrospira sp.]
MIVIEPFRQDNRIAGWIRLVVATPPEAAALRSEDDLGRDVALVIGPLLLVMVILLTLTMRGLMSRVRTLLAGILMEAGEQRSSRPGIPSGHRRQGLIHRQDIPAIGFESTGFPLRDGSGLRCSTSANYSAYSEV